MKLYVGNLPFSVLEDELRTLFQAFGDVTDAHVVRDRETQRSRGFGFVEMGDADAEAAIAALNDKPLKGRNLQVNQARPKEAAPRGNRPQRRF